VQKPSAQALAEGDRGTAGSPLGNVTAYDADGEVIHVDS
jgi:hypothetical protein